MNKNQSKCDLVIMKLINEMLTCIYKQSQCQKVDKFDNLMWYKLSNCGHGVTSV